MTVGAQDNYSIWAFETMLARYGFFEKLEDLNTGNVKWTNDDFIHYFEKVEEMRDNGTFTEDIANIGYFEAKERFLGGNAAMLRWHRILDFSGGLHFQTANILSRLELKHPVVYMWCPQKRPGIQPFWMRL